MSILARRGPAGAPDLQAYLREIDGTALLSRAEERELGGRVAGGDAAARDRLIRANLRLVVHLARGYLGRGLGLDDLVAEGNLGLVRAVEGYDAGSGVRFGTYAAFWIKQSLRRGVMNQARPVRLPAHAVTLLSKWRRASRALAGRLGREPTPEEVAGALRLPGAKMGLALQALEVERLMGPAGGLGEDAAAGELAEARGGGVEERAAEAEELDRAVACLDRLGGREATVLRMRFGLAPYAPMSLSEAGAALGLTGSRVRQIEKEALRRLESAMGGAERCHIAEDAAAG